MFNPSRDQARQFFFDSWRKYTEKRPLSGLEGMAAAVMAAHPEYHALLDAPARHLEREYLPEHGETNPFLHLSMHLAVREQLSIDQPQGVAAHYRRLLARTGSEHEAEHLLMDCLAEMIWQAQHQGAPPDGSLYLGCLERQR